MSAAVAFSMVPCAIPARCAELPEGGRPCREETLLRLQLRAESPHCALDQDPEAAVSELRCPVCGRRGWWEAECESGRLFAATPDQVDHEPYKGRKTSAVLIGAWRCTAGHETREPVRPRHEPRGGGARAKASAPGRNAREDLLVALCDAMRRG